MTSAILTASGKWFDVLSPDPALIDLADIAAALSKLCRFGGHCKAFYSVAEHSILVSRLVARLGGSQEEIIWGLLHDASEAYVVDIPRPLKAQLPHYAAIEADVQKAVASRLGLSWPVPEIAQRADNSMLALELRAYMPPQPEDRLPPIMDQSPCCAHPSGPMSHSKALNLFLDTAVTLGIA